MIHTYDHLADECVEILNGISAGTGSEQPFEKDLYGLLKAHADEHPKLKRLWNEVNTVPEWVDWEQIQRAQDVFFRYGLPILNVVSGISGDGIVSSLLTISSSALRAFLVACMNDPPKIFVSPDIGLLSDLFKGEQSVSWRLLLAQVDSIPTRSDVDYWRLFSTCFR